MTFLDNVITLVMLKSFISCSQSHGFILRSQIPWLRLTIQKQKWDYSSFCPCQSRRVWLFSCRPQSRLQGAIVRWHYCPTNATKSQIFYITKKLLMHYLAQRSGAISRRILSFKMDSCSKDSRVIVRWLWGSMSGQLQLLSCSSLSLSLHLVKPLILNLRFLPNTISLIYSLFNLNPVLSCILTIHLVFKLHIWTGHMYLNLPLVFRTSLKIC